LSNFKNKNNPKKTGNKTFYKYFLTHEKLSIISV